MLPVDQGQRARLPGFATRAGEQQRRNRTGSAERSQLWAQLEKIYPPYADYQKATEREIPVVVLDPI